MITMVNHLAGHTAVNADVLAGDDGYFIFEISHIHIKSITFNGTYSIKGGEFGSVFTLGQTCQECGGGSSGQRSRGSRCPSD